MAIQSSQLAMVYLVKNEIDIIDLNIRFHQALGISQFIVMDNGSTDGTLEYLQELSKKIDLIVINNPDKRYLQSKWMTAMAKQARKEFGVSHVIPNDADEFWWPRQGGTLAENIEENIDVQTCHRYNRVLTQAMKEQEQPFYCAENFVKAPIFYDGDTQIHDPAASMQLVKISPKVIVKPQYLWQISGGNHRAKSLRPWSKSKKSKIDVHHFPIRSFHQFKTNISERAKKLDKPGVRMGPHIRRWVPLFNEGKLEQEFDHMLLTDRQINILNEIGVLNQETELPAILKDLTKR